ncbi:hypothetical protein E0Z10_g9653 [Xylaria hypoxylon]|uniref:ABC transporter domain-containing protein n=1 Tax=Xylaria hypoxylon TaxID=37992 RepID=A0A4Z0YRG9_9PEZI|nr:hypothetical protein E0Z10_g9653 [Xylaria hypoxylon]
MLPPNMRLAAFAAVSLSCVVAAQKNYTQMDMMKAQLALMGDRPACGSLARGRDRPIRSGDTCDCDDGWTGINCNVCTDDKSCNALMETGEDGVCYQNGEVVNNNYQMCGVTNEKILSMLDGNPPRLLSPATNKMASVTFNVSNLSVKLVDLFTGQTELTSNVLVWVDRVESFYCHLDNCESSATFTSDQNSTNYKCPDVQCSCIQDRFLCGLEGSIDLTDFLKESVEGPATFECMQQDGGVNECKFKEPQLDWMVQSIFGDESIKLDCRSGECLYHTEVPGYQRPVKTINTPLIAGVIAGCSLFVLAVILVTWYFSRRQYKYGAIHLDDSDDESTKLMTDHKPATLYFENVSYGLNGKAILSDIRGIAHPGEITAIMGASGAGKTSFLDILARKNKRGHFSGDFYVNGEKVSDADFKSVMGFVDQEDTMLPTLTVHETILTSALLRLPRHMGRAAKEQRVSEVEKQLGIYHIRDSLIGSEEGKGRGISGGEKRRVGIACELVTSPSVLFLDEPTSGLDAYNAYNVIECLVTLAKSYKRTVIFTIHQPRSNIVALFDRLILLAQGKTVFSGPFSRCQDYFDEIGYACPPGFNIADYLVDLTMHASNAGTFDDGSLLNDSASSVGPSSTQAVKSVASISGNSTAEESSIAEPSSSRPLNKRKNSVRARQERELFTRRKNTADTAASSDVEEEVGAYKLHKQPAGVVPPQIIVEDAHDLPPAAGSNLDTLVQSFAESDIAGDVHDEIQQVVATAREANGRNGLVNGNGNSSAIGRGYARIGYLRQFIILSQRTWRNLYRNPLLMLTHYAIAIVLAVLSGYLFYGLTDDIPGFQNRLGLFFFLLALFGFSTLTSLNVFASERLLFVRERANGYYSPITYFVAKIVFDIVPLRIIPPIIMGAIIYPMTGLIPDAPHFFTFMLTLVLFNLAAAAICFFIGIVCKDGSVANLIGSLVMLFSLLFAGLLLNHNKIPDAALWLQSLSIFHYGFEALIVNEVVKLTLVDKKYGLDITVPGAAILSSFGFDNGAKWMDIANLGIFAAIFVVLAYAAMHFLLVERR